MDDRPMMDLLRQAMDSVDWQTATKAEPLRSVQALALAALAEAVAGWSDGGLGSPRR